MIKRAYTNRKISKQDVLDQTLTPPAAFEDLSSSSMSGVGRGYVMPGEATQPPTLKESEEAEPLIEEPKREYSSANSEKLMNLFLDIGDSLDNDGLHSEADFIDFLIVKVAQYNNYDHAMLFKNLLIKIIKSDLSNSQDIVKMVVKNYNNILKEKISQGIDKSEAEKIAYQNSVDMANKYVTRFN